MVPTLHRAASFFTLAALALCACHTPITQLIVVVDSDLGTQVRSVDIEVDGAAPATLSVAIPERATFPFSFGVQRADGASAAQVVVTARDAAGAALVRRSARALFVIGETRRLVVHLERSCAAVYASCAAEQTCRAGACTTESVMESELTDAVPGEELLGLPSIVPVDASVMPDARPSDAGPVCAPICGADETCGADELCHCGAGASCGEDARCESGSCVPWPRSCDGLVPGRGCDVVSITGGAFTMGDRDADQEDRTAALPFQPNISVSAFRADAYEVTIARFRRFWDAGHPIPSGPIMYPGGALPFAGEVGPPVEDMDARCNWMASAGSRAMHPVNCVTWSTALAFCVWDGGRLPTEAEFEYIARHRVVAGLPSPRAYPWGDDRPSGLDFDGLPCDLAHAFGCPGEGAAITLPVGSFPAAGGLYDLAGSMLELAADHYSLYQFMGDPPSPACWDGTPRANPLCQTGPQVAMRGGSASTGSPNGVRGATRASFMFMQAAPYVGFRCVYP